MKAQGNEISKEIAFSDNIVYKCIQETSLFTKIKENCFEDNIQN